MSFKNIYYDSKSSNVHLWTDTGYFKFPYVHYAYKKTKKNSKFKTIYGENVVKLDISDIPYDHRSRYLEHDVRPDVRTLVDLFYESDKTSETNVTMNFDIETEKSKKHGHSKPRDALNRVLSITSHIWETDEWKVWVLDEHQRYKNKNNYNFVEVCKDEYQLLNSFLKYYNKVNPSILTGWNISLYDVPYLVYRIQRLFSNDKYKLLSPIKIVTEHDTRKGEKFNILAGKSQLDYMRLYKNYCPKNRPSYKLDYISWIELGERKVEYEGSLQDLYERDLDEFIRYNLEDVNLVRKFEEKLKYIASHRKLCHYAHVPYEFGIMSTILHEGIIMTYSKEKNLVWYNRPQVKDEGHKIVGAYVKDSKAGRFDMTFDQDLTSLYPMTIVTCNISPETKYAKIRNYITVWEDKTEKAKKGKTKFEINRHIFDETKKIPDLDKPLDITIDLIRTDKSYNLKSFRELYKFLINHNCTLSANGILYKKDKVGILPEIILDIFKDRKKYKSLRDEYKVKGDNLLTDYYDQEQWKYKIVMNSLYGVLLEKSFRLHDVDNGQSITMTGRYSNISGMDETLRLFKSLKTKAVENWGEIKDKELNDLFKDPIITGDTDSIILTSVPYLYTKYGNKWKEKPMKEKVDDTIKLSVNLADRINKRMDVFAKKWLNADENYLSFKQEWVAESGFFVGVKKRYANKIIWQEGVDVNYLDIKGLDIIRSSFPKQFQDFMKGLLTKILNNEEKDKIFDYILTFKEEIYEKAHEDINAISVISSVNNHDNYINDKNDFIKGTPWHLRGVANYNSLIDYYNKNEYIRITESDKIGVVYLRPNRFGFEKMSFPLDHDIPSEIWEFIQETTDPKESISKIIDKKLQKYYDVMEWEEPKREEEKISSLFEFEEL